MTSQYPGVGIGGTGSGIGRTDCEDYKNQFIIKTRPRKKEFKFNYEPKEGYGFTAGIGSTAPNTLYIDYISINGGVGGNISTGCTHLTVKGEALFQDDALWDWQAPEGFDPMAVEPEERIGPVLRSPNGTKWRIIVDDAGNLDTEEATTCEDE